MAFKCLSSAWLLLLCVSLSSCLPHPQVLNRGKRSQMRLCGKMLVDALAMVCENVYYDPNNAEATQLRKRNNYQYIPDSPYVVMDPTLTEFEGFMDPETALDFLGGQQVTPRQQRGIADECCVKSCTFSTLMSYCGNARRK